MRSIIPYLLLAVLTCVSAQASSAILPSTLNYQGRLRDLGTGQPVPDGSGNTVQFRLCQDPGCGTPLWTETWNGGTSHVSTKDGLFNVILGTYNPLSLAFDSEYFLEITWTNLSGTPETLTPRQPLTMAPYAFRAKYAESANLVAPYFLSGTTGAPVFSATNYGGGYGLWGDADSGGIAGVYGRSASPSGIGVLAINPAGGQALHVSGNARFVAGSTTFAAHVDFSGATVTGLAMGGVSAPLSLTLNSTTAAPFYASNNTGSAVSASASASFGVPIAVVANSANTFASGSGNVVGVKADAQALGGSYSGTVYGGYFNASVTVNTVNAHGIWGQTNGMASSAGVFGSGVINGVWGQATLGVGVRGVSTGGGGVGGVFNATFGAMVTGVTYGISATASNGRGIVARNSSATAATADLINDSGPALKATGVTFGVSATASSGSGYAFHGQVSSNASAGYFRNNGSGAGVYGESWQGGAGVKGTAMTSPGPAIHALNFGGSNGPTLLVEGGYTAVSITTNWGNATKAIYGRSNSANDATAQFFNDNTGSPLKLNSYSFPAGGGSAGEVLTSDGIGQLYWAAGGGVTAPLSLTLNSAVAAPLYAENTGGGMGLHVKQGASLFEGAVTVSGVTASDGLMRVYNSSGTGFALAARNSVGRALVAEGGTVGLSATASAGGTGAYGEADGGGAAGVMGRSADATGVVGTSTSGTGVNGNTSTGPYGVYGNANGAGTGVHGKSNAGTGVVAEGAAYGLSATASDGTSGTGIYVRVGSSEGWAIDARNDDGGGLPTGAIRGHGVNSTGIVGTSDNDAGVSGYSPITSGVVGGTDGGGGAGIAGVSGNYNGSANRGFGVRGSYNTAVANSAGVMGQMGFGGAIPSIPGAGAGVFGLSYYANGIGVYAVSNNANGVALVAEGVSLGVSATATSGPAVYGRTGGAAPSAEFVNTGAGPSLKVGNLSFPTGNGTAGFLLSTNGSNQMSWVAPGGVAAPLSLTLSSALGAPLHVSNGVGVAISATAGGTALKATGGVFGVSATVLATSGGAGVYAKVSMSPGSETGAVVAVNQWTGYAIHAKNTGSGIGLYASANGGFGLQGDSTSSTGVRGNAFAGGNPGVHGENGASGGLGVFARATSGLGLSAQGLTAVAAAGTSIGLSATASGAGGVAGYFQGGTGLVAAASGAGVSATASGAAGLGAWLRGVSVGAAVAGGQTGLSLTASFADGMALVSRNNSTYPNVFAVNEGNGMGLDGQSLGSGYGVYGYAASGTGVYGVSGNYGMVAQGNGIGISVTASNASGIAVYAQNNSVYSTIYGRNEGGAPGVWGESISGRGVVGVSYGNAVGVSATTAGTTTYALFASASTNSTYPTVWAENDGSGPALYGQTANAEYGVWGYNSGTGTGVFGWADGPATGSGVWGRGEVAGLGGSSGVLAYHQASAVTGTPTMALDIDGGIAVVTTARGDAPVGTVTLGASGGTFAHPQLRSNSIVLLTPLGVTARSVSVSNQLSGSCVINYTGGAGCTFMYMIINQH